MGKRILCDYDSTLAASFVGQLALLNAEFGTAYTHADFTTWHTEEICAPEEVAFLWSDRCFLSEEFQASVAPVEGAIEGMQALLAAGHHCIIISDRPAQLFEVTRDWLDRQGLEMVRLLFTRHKHSRNSGAAESGMTKPQAAWAYRLDTVIEDAMHHALAFAEKPWIERVYMLDSPHNYEVEHPKVERCFGWADVCAHLVPQAVLA